MKCEVIVGFEDAPDRWIGRSVQCGRDAIFCDNNVRMCFTCARAMCNEGDVLTKRGERRFREIERVVYSLPS